MNPTPYPQTHQAPWKTGKVTAGGAMLLLLGGVGWAILHIAKWTVKAIAGMARDPRWWPTLGAMLALVSALISPWMALPWLVIAVGMSEMVRRGKSLWLSLQISPVKRISKGIRVLERWISTSFGIQP